MRAFAVFAASLLAAAPAMAQTPSVVPGAPDPARAVSGTYTVDSAHTQLLFTVMHLGMTEYTGQFVTPTGTLVLDTKNPGASKVEVVFPVAKVSTTVAALDAHLKSPDFFDSDKYPEARFVSTKIVTTGTKATIMGNLTLKGVTKPVVLQARFVGAGTNARTNKVYVGFQATGTVKRSDFGITYTLPMVSDEVALTINAGFQQQ